MHAFIYIACDLPADTISDEELACKLQEEEARRFLPDTKGDMELAQQLQEEAIIENPKNNESLARKPQVESRSPFPPSLDEEIAHSLQEEEDRRHQEEKQVKDKEIEKDQMLARQLQQEESSDHHTSSSSPPSLDAEIACNLQEEENRKHQEEKQRKEKEIENDQNLARQLQQEKPSSYATATPSATIQTLKSAHGLQERKFGTAHELEIDQTLAMQLQQEESSNQQTSTVFSAAMGRFQNEQEDGKIAFQLQQEEYTNHLIPHFLSTSNTLAINGGDRLVQDAPKPSEWEDQSHTTETKSMLSFRLCTPPQPIVSQL